VILETPGGDVTGPALTIEGTVVEPPPPPPPPPDGISATQQQMLELTNAERVKAGVAPLKASAALMKAAQDYAQVMRDRNWFSHTGPDGSTPADRITAAGYRFSAYAENIARGQPIPAAVVAAWMESPGHRSNLLSATFMEVGMGAAGDNWVQDFGRPR
jgi:uncharacterized protein YkwD